MRLSKTVLSKGRASTGSGMPRMCRFATILIARKIWSRLHKYFCRGYRGRRRAFLTRILFCNKYNFRFSGTEVYLFELMQLLRSQGHEVALFSMADPRGEPTAYDQHFVPAINFKEECGLREKCRRVAHAIYSRESRKKIRAMIQDFRPDVAHVRNIYHHLSP